MHMQGRLSGCSNIYLGVSGARTGSSQVELLAKEDARALIKWRLSQVQPLRDSS